MNINQKQKIYKILLKSSNYPMISIKNLISFLTNPIYFILLKFDFLYGLIPEKIYVVNFVKQNFYYYYRILSYIY